VMKRSGERDDIDRLWNVGVMLSNKQRSYSSRPITEREAMKVNRELRLDFNSLLW
jgi:hypothetical protein